MKNFWGAFLAMVCMLFGLLPAQRVLAGEIKGKVTAQGIHSAENIAVYGDAIPGKTFNAPSSHVVMDQIKLTFIITLGGSAMGKSAMMPPWGRTLKQGDIKAVIAFERAIAQPPYKPPALPGPKYSVK